MNLHTEFQTPLEVAVFMCGLIPENAKTILEPTPGQGNIVSILEAIGRYEITAPADFFSLQPSRYDCVVMNPPFSDKYGFNVPENLKGSRLGYWILTKCMEWSDHVIVLTPWFTLTDSDNRLRFLNNYGLKSITALQRKTFRNSRTQTCVLELEKGFNGNTLFRSYETVPLNLNILL